MEPLTAQMTEAAPSAVDPVAFGRYTLLGKLGSGGMADALLAMLNGSLGFQKLVVLKRMHASLAGDRHFVQMFLDEARLAARLNHANVVQTTEVGEVEGQYFIAMEYLEGQSLDRVARHYLQDRAAMPVGMLLRVLCDALDGLHHAHELRDYDGTPLAVVHRDVTPSNLFVTYDGIAKVLDFGIAKAATQDEATRTGMLKGKLAYMSPEQFHAAAIDRRSDLWSMGIVLWEMLTGRRLFKGPNDVATYKNITSAKVPPVSSFRADAPPALDVVIARALERDRDKRYPTADAMRADLEALFGRDVSNASRADVGAEMRARFGETIEQNRRVVREFVRLGTEQTGERLGLSSLGALRPGAGGTLSPSLSLNARDLGIPAPPRAMAPASSGERTPTGSGPVFVEEGADSSEPTQVNVKPFGREALEAPIEPSGEAFPLRSVKTQTTLPMGTQVPVVPPSALATGPSLPRPEALAPPPFVAAPSLEPVVAFTVPMPVMEAAPLEAASPPEEPQFDPLPPSLVRKDKLKRVAVSMVGYALLLAVLGALAGGTYLLRHSLRRGVDQLVHGAPPDPAILGSFELTLQSIPPGARVTEGSEVLGQTPLQLTVRRAQVQQSPRRFTLEMQGFHTTGAVQVNTLQPTATLTVTLVPIDAPPLPEAPHVPARPQRPNRHAH